MKKIGIFMGNVIQDYQRTVLKTIFDEAGRLGYTVFCFSNFGVSGDKVLFAEGEREMIHLPELTQYEGIIVSEDTFNVPGMGDELYEYLKSNAKCPVVYLRIAREGFYSVVLDDGEAIRNMIRHFTDFHGFRDICFMTGNLDNADARKRYQGFLDAMKELNIEVTEHMVFEGDYWREKGKEAVDWFLEGRQPGNYPQAIICSNDYMALSVCEEIQNRGIHIPEDICVSGYDDVIEGREAHPVLTTVHVPFKNLGKRAIEIIEEVRKGEKPELVTSFAPTPSFRHSCGCKDRTDENHNWQHLHDKLEETSIIYNQTLFLNADYQESFDEEACMKVAERYFSYLGCSRGYLCLCQPVDHEVRQLSDSFTEKMILRKTFFKNGKSTDQNEIFHRRELLPASIRRQINKKALIVFDLHFKNCILGYLVLQIAEGEWPTDFGQAYMMALANAIENGSAQKEIEDLEQYRKLYRRDELTGLYNRRGYESSLRSLYSRSKKEKCQLTVVSIDMDGLKYINDHYGHAEGDEALFRLAVVLAELMEENEICARVGGDEFVVLLYYNEEGREERFVKDLEELLLEEQQRNPKPYPVHASVGYCCVSKNANLSLAACVQLADTRMYENKKAYKESLESSEASHE